MEELISHSRDLWEYSTMREDLVKTFFRKFIEELCQMIAPGLNYSHHNYSNMKSHISVICWGLLMSKTSVKRALSIYTRKRLCVTPKPDKLRDKVNRLKSKHSKAIMPWLLEQKDMTFYKVTVTSEKI